MNKEPEDEMEEARRIHIFWRVFEALESLGHAISAFPRLLNRDEEEDDDAAEE